MGDTRKTLQERIDEDGITSEARYGAETQPEWATGNDGWTVTLAFDGRTMVTPFFMGAAYNSEEPTAAQVLETLLSDAAGYYNSNGFEDWASEYGYDTDSRKVEATYNAVMEQAVQLSDFLGEKLNAYLWETDSD